MYLFVIYIITTLTFSKFRMVDSRVPDELFLFQMSDT